MQTFTHDSVAIPTFTVNDEIPFGHQCYIHPIATNIFAVQSQQTNNKLMGLPLSASPCWIFWSTTEVPMTAITAAALFAIWLNMSIKPEKLEIKFQLANFGFPVATLKN